MLRSGLFLLLVILLVLANGFFVASEFSLVAVRRSRVASLAAEGHRRYKRLLRVIDNLNAYISATQLGITVNVRSANGGHAVFGTDRAKRRYYRRSAECRARGRHPPDGRCR